MSMTSEASDEAWPVVSRKPASSFRWTHGFINRLITLADIAAFTLIAAAAILIDSRMDGYHHPSFVIVIAALEAAIFVLIQQSVMAYRFESYLNLRDSLPRAMMGLAIAWAAAALVTVVALPFSAATLAWFAVFNLPQVAAFGGLRLGARMVAGHIDRIALMRQRTIVIGDGPEAEAMVQRLSEPDLSAEFNVVGVVAHASVAPSGLFAGRPLLGGLSVLPTLTGRESIDLVIIATPPTRVNDLAVIFDALHWVAADVVLLLSAELGQAMHGPRRDIAGQPMLQLTQRPLKGSQAITKLIEDQIICVLALLLLGPIMLLIAILIRLDSPGPALFRQERIGLSNHVFRIFKFRTMTVDLSDDGTKGTVDKRDRRITRIGRFLRSSSLDELPQLLNVFKGDMSVVGPRPYVARMRVEDETFDSVVRSFAARHRVKPGITGLAQASGFRSNALRDKNNAALSVKLDLQYIANWSPWLDLQIIVRTVLLAMSGPEVF